LQRKIIVDAVISEDIDSLMFGSAVSKPVHGRRAGVGSPTHVDKHVLESAPIDRKGIILVAIISGGDYLPKGIPQYGSITAIKAVKAGFREAIYAAHGDAEAIRA